MNGGPVPFGHGVVIPLVKNADGNRFVTENYRGITISHIWLTYDAWH